MLNRKKQLYVKLNLLYFNHFPKHQCLKQVQQKNTVQICPNHLQQIIVILQPLSKTRCFSPKPTPPIHRLPCPRIPVFQTSFRQLDGLVTKSSFGSWEGFFRRWKGEKIEKQMKTYMIFMVIFVVWCSFCETFQTRFHYWGRKKFQRFCSFFFTKKWNVYRNEQTCIIFV